MQRRRQPPPEPPTLNAGAVTRIAPQKKNPDRVSIFIDGRFAFGLGQDVLLEQGVHLEMALSVEAQRDLLEADAYHRARAKAMDLLSFKPRTASELHTKLTDRGFTEAVADRTVARFTELGYIDDERYAATFVRDRVQVKRHGLRRIERDLSRRGVARATIERAVAEVEDGAVLEAARAAARRRIPKLRRVTDTFRRRKKVFDFLARRGFSFDIVHKVLDELDLAPPGAAEQDQTMTHRRPIKTSSKKDRPAPTAEEALELAIKRWEQLTQLEPSAYRRQKKLRDYLKRRSVPFDVIRDVVDRVLVLEAEGGEGEAEGADVEGEVEPDEATLFEEALDLAQGRWRTLTRLESDARKRERKLTSFLQRRGYRFDLIRRVLDDDRLAEG